MPFPALWKEKGQSCGWTAQVIIIRCLRRASGPVDCCCCVLDCASCLGSFSFLGTLCFSPTVCESAAISFFPLSPTTALLPNVWPDLTSKQSITTKQTAFEWRNWVASLLVPFFFPHSWWYHWDWLPRKLCLVFSPLSVSLSFCLVYSDHIRLCNHSEWVRKSSRKHVLRARLCRWRVEFSCEMLDWLNMAHISFHESWRMATWQRVPWIDLFSL